LLEEGVMVDALCDAVNKEVDLFEIIFDVAFDQPPLNMRERADNVKKRIYFTKYSETTKKILETF